MMYSITIMISKIFLTMHNAHYRVQTLRKWREVHYISSGRKRERDCARVGPALLVPGKSIITVWLDSFELACIVLTELQLIAEILTRAVLASLIIIFQRCLSYTGNIGNTLLLQLSPDPSYLKSACRHNNDIVRDNVVTGQQTY